MTYSRFVAPHTDVLTLENGDTLIVRRRLNVGEEHASFGACYTVETHADGTIARVFDPTKVGRAKVAAYLVEWHMADAPDLRALDFLQRMAVVENLDPIDFADIKAAIDAHEARQLAARTEEKKRARTTAGDPISPSRFDAAGALTGSAS